MDHDSQAAPAARRRRPAAIQGAFLMLAACVAFGCMGITVRHLTQNLPPFEVVFFRNALSLAWMMPILAHQGFAVLRTAHFGLYAWRSAIALATMLCWFTALKSLPLAEATALSFTQPLFATVLAVIMLHEIVRRRRWTATIIGFIGAMIILRPGVAEVSFAHVLLLTSSLIGALNAITVKQLTRTEHPNAIVTYMTLLITPFSLAIALPGWESVPLSLWPWLAAMGFFGMLGHQLSTRAFGLIDASLVSAFDFMRLPFSALLAWIIFAEVPDRWTWIGGAIIAGASIYIARREAQLARAASLEPPATTATGTDAGATRVPHARPRPPAAEKRADDG